MKLLVKFSVIFALVFGAGLAGAAYLSYHFLQRNARDQVLQEARLMMETSMSMRQYTSQQVKPLLAVQQQQNQIFLPQTVPAYAATENFNYLRAKYPEYGYREATLNPTNLRDRAVDWEADVVNNFRNSRDLKELTGERDTPTGKSLFLARPIKANVDCLECHSTPDVAPAAMIKTYGSANGFGWHPNEIIGAQIVSVPMSVPIKMADQGFQRLLLSLGGVALLTLIALDLVLFFTVVRPVTQLSAAADQISQGNLDVPESPVRGNDEVAVLAGSFNRMHRSLVKALRLLEEQ